MKSLTIFSGELHLLHHFKSDFCSSFRSLKFSHWTLERQNMSKNLKIWITRYNSRTFAHFWDSMKNWSSFYWYKSTSYWTVPLYDVRRTWQKYLRIVLHENAVLTIGLTDQSDYSICLLYGQISSIQYSYY